ncbi:7,8-dihydroneopterin aldolase [Leuconostoc litchii]|uniref:7,8-dihydroneopterin aldolase n=1 Tax=Leuconostoc litchii TaxID=1981069 RepID=A0A652NE95_9LACO|nr:dihydroneopterin aldolase [Leuconostoc litchii]TYC46511.1 dihydroneopterin aldolase [Leuconostoc litchii]GMA70173.1 7,8-dihydroneopterin aldolase [Leuconostoc litchii]
MGTIHLPNMRFYTYNGVFSAEKQLGQPLSIDATVTYPIEVAVHDDDLNTTISYVDIYQAVEKRVNNTQVNLIESLANDILFDLLAQFKQAEKVLVAVKKHAIPLPGIYDPFVITVSGTQADLVKRGQI